VRHENRKESTVNRLLSGEEVFLDLGGLFYYFTDFTDIFGGNSAGMRRRT